MALGAGGPLIFPKMRGTFLGGPYNKVYIILVCILGSPYFGKCHLKIFGFRRKAGIIKRSYEKATVQMKGGVSLYLKSSSCFSYTLYTHTHQYQKNT